MDCSTDMKNGLKEAKRLLGIDFRYKLDDTLSSMPKGVKLTREQISGYLTKRGVSPKEIKQSGIVDTELNEAMTGKEWIAQLDSMGNSHHINTTKMAGRYPEITMNRGGINNESNIDKLYTINTPKAGGYGKTHYSREVRNISKPKNNSALYEPKVGDTKETLDNVKKLQSVSEDLSDEIFELTSSGMREVDALNNIVVQGMLDSRSKLLDSIYKARGGKKEQELLGWIRVHTSLVDGKISTVLNELQSDWAQYERSGAGLFNKSVKSPKQLKEIEDKLKSMGSRRDTLMEMDRLSNKELQETINTIEDITDLRVSNSNYRNVLGRGRANDIPMDPVKLQQLQIVKSIDHAIKTGTNRVVIPIDRVNELVGTKGVTKAYKMLNPTLDEAEEFVKAQEFTKWKKANIYRNRSFQEGIMTKSKGDIKKQEKYINSRVLPQIRKKLASQGLTVNLSRKTIPGMDITAEDMVNKFEYAYTNTTDRLAWDNFLNSNAKYVEDSAKEISGSSMLKDMKAKGLKLPSKFTYDELIDPKQEVHILDIVPKAGKKVSWNMWSVIGAITGVGGTSAAVNDNSAEAQLDNI